MKHSSFIIAAPSSESGKSTITIGLLRALSRQGLKVQPYKCGPDYIDPKLHQNASGMKSINLDLFMQSEVDVKALFERYQCGNDVSIVEGVMGLFDGYDRDKGSTAHLAEVLQQPILLVITPKSMAYSVAPLLYGIKNFRPQLNIIGVIFNKVNSPGHAKYLTDACEDVGLDVLGIIPTNKSLSLPSRHLGLITEDKESLETHANKVANLVDQHIDLHKLISITTRDIQPPKTTQSRKGTKRISVACDEAFNFIYPENIRLLESFGIVSYFSPIKDTEIPPCDLLYLPGGYPELYLRELSSNQSMIQQIRDHIQGNHPLIAECGGMLYLCKSLIDQNGTEYPLVGYFDHSATMQNPKLTIGYRHLEILGEKLRGHEFHYSHLIEPTGGISNQKNAIGLPVNTLLFQSKNVIATYTHTMFTENLIHKILSLSD